MAFKPIFNSGALNIHKGFKNEYDRRMRPTGMKNFEIVENQLFDVRIILR